MADFVAKVGEQQFASKIRKNRIWTNGFLNQHCTQMPDLESMLLARMRKIFLQQYLHRRELPAPPTEGCSLRCIRSSAGYTIDTHESRFWKRQQARLAAFRQGLQQLGWTDGRNVRIDARWGGGNASDTRKFAAELVAPPTGDFFKTSVAGFSANGV